MSCTVLFSLFVFPFISCFCFSIRFQLFWALEAVTILKTASMLVSRAQTNQHYKCGDDTQQCARCTIQLKTFLSLTASLAATLMDWAFSLSLTLWYWHPLYRPTYSFGPFKFQLLFFFVLSCPCTCQCCKHTQKKGSAVAFAPLASHRYPKRETSRVLNTYS